jgi:hypothetical protein
MSRPANPNMQGGVQLPAEMVWTRVQVAPASTDLTSVFTPLIPWTPPQATLA